MDTIIDKITNGINAPIYQALMGIMIMCFICIMGALMQTESTDPLFSWIAFSTVLLLYALYNSIISIKSQRLGFYFQRSIFSYLGLLFLGSFIAKFFSNVPIEEAGSMKWLCIVFSFGYIVIFVIMVLTRKIMEYAQSAD